MTVSEEARKMSPAQKEFIEQAKRRMKNIKGMEKDIKTRMRLCTSERCKEIESWFDTVDSLKSQAAVEIEMVEMAAENEWASRRQRVDQFLGETEREYETGYYILEKPE
ncbi:MAG: hypothetical protein PHV39_06540 [Methanomicrobium sp.]|nr:hypothetical protein [Methanomicrobium sp.]